MSEPRRILWLALAASGLLFPGARLLGDGAEPPGVVMELQGNVLRKNVRDEGWAPAIRGFLLAGARLKTGDNARAVIMLSDDRIFTVEPNSEAQVTAHEGAVDVKCLSGKVSAGKKGRGGFVSWLYSRFTSAKAAGGDNQVASTRSPARSTAGLFPNKVKIRSSRITLRWPARAGVSKYVLVVKRDGKEILRQEPLAQEGIEANRFDLTAEFPPGDYAWSVETPGGEKIGSAGFTIISEEDAQALARRIEEATPPGASDQTRSLVAGVICEQLGLTIDAMTHYEEALKRSGGADLMAKRLLAIVKKELGAE